MRFYLGYKMGLYLPTFSMRNTITSIIDFFYPAFKRIMPLQTFRYAACGGSNMVVGFLVFTIVYNITISQKEVVDFGFIVFKPHSFSLFCSSITTFILGFFLNKYVVFTSSNLRGRVQFFRYFLAALSSFCINYFLLNTLVLYLHIYPVLAQVIVTAIVVTISFFMQQYFTFKIKEETE